MMSILNGLQKPRTLLFVSAVCLMSAQVKAEGPVQEKTYLFGIVPQQAATRLAKMWLPLMSQLSMKTGLSINFATTKDIPTFETCLAKGAYEFAYMNPYHYTVFHKQSGYQAFANQAEKKLKGIVVVRKDSKAQKLEDLDGASFAFPSPAAFGASVLPRAEMRQKGMAFTSQYVKSHDSVYRSVAGGFHAAGGGVTRTYKAASADIKNDLRIIYETKAYTPHAFTAHGSVPQEDVQKVFKAMMELAKERPELVQKIGMAGFQKAKDSDWDDVRALNLTQKATGIVREGKIVCRSD